MERAAVSGVGAAGRRFVSRLEGLADPSLSRAGEGASGAASDSGQEWRPVHWRPTAARRRATGRVGGLAPALYRSA